MTAENPTAEFAEYINMDSFFVAEQQAAQQNAQHFHNNADPYSMLAPLDAYPSYEDKSGTEFHNNNNNNVQYFYENSAVQNSAVAQQLMHHQTDYYVSKKKSCELE